MRVTASGRLRRISMAMLPPRPWAISAKRGGSLPSVREGKSSTGRTASLASKRPARSVSWLSPPGWSSSIFAASGSLRTSSNSVAAGAVVRPVRVTVTPGTSSTTAISMSVAVRRRPPSRASSRTFARMGMVLRRSTTLCTCASALSSTALSTVNFMAPDIPNF